MEKKTYIVSLNDEGQRLDKYIKKIMANAPLNFIYRLIREKDIKVNNKKVEIDYVLKNEDEVSIFLSEEQANSFLSSYEFPRVEKKFKVLYEDDNILVVHKPAGVLVHSAPKEKIDTLANMVLTYLYENGDFHPDKRGYIPSPVARIDEDTDGIVVFAKKQMVHQQLATAFSQETEVIRLYRLVVYGNILLDKGRISSPLKKINGKVVVNENGQSAITMFKVVSRANNKTYVEAQLLTGRQHQIRVHFASEGYPLVGDKKYGIVGDKNEFALNAYSLMFTSLAFPLSYLNGKTFIADNTEKLIKILGE